MYVNKIDEFIDTTLDKFNILLEQNLLFQDFKTNPNFADKRTEINTFIQNFMDNLDLSPVQDIAQSQEDIEYILDLVWKYVAYYYFLSLAFEYTAEFETYRNNI